MTRIALIGLGEVGRVFAEDLAAAGFSDIAAWDVAFSDSSSRAAQNGRDLAIDLSRSSAEAVTEARFVVSAVTAAHCVAAAEAVASSIASGAWFFDLNSSSPGHKQVAAATIDAAGGRYVEAALMSPIGPRRLGSPFLLGGPHAQAFSTEAASWGITGASVYSSDVGVAAATKLCRSVIVKGLESILTESMLAARHYGVEREVLDSLPNILPPADWEQVAAYFMSRSLQHGQRRSEEMAEAAATVADSGIEPIMTDATVRRQAWAAQFFDAHTETDLMSMVDAVRREIITEEPA